MNANRSAGFFEISRTRCRAHYARQRFTQLRAQSLHAVSPSSMRTCLVDVGERVERTNPVPVPLGFDALRRGRCAEAVDAGNEGCGWEDPHHPQWPAFTCRAIRRRALWPRSATRVLAKGQGCHPVLTFRANRGGSQRRDRAKPGAAAPGDPGVVSIGFRPPPRHDPHHDFVDSRELLLYVPLELGHRVLRAGRPRCGFCKNREDPVPFDHPRNP